MEDFRKVFFFLKRAIGIQQPELEARPSKICRIKNL